MNYFSNKVKIVLKHKVTKNFMYLNAVQLMNYIFPFITFPYISRIFTPHGYGLVITATSFASYLGLFTDFGFNLSATRDLAKANFEKNKIEDIFNNVLSAKLVLFMIFFSLFMFFLLSTHYIENLYIFVLSLMGVLGNVLFPTWYFQSMNMMNKIAKLNLFSRLFGVILLVSFIHKDSDIELYVFLNSVISLSIGIMALNIAVRTGQLRLYFKYQIKNFITVICNSFASFTAVLLVSFYTVFNTLLLSWFCSYKDVAVYGVADKIISIVLTIQGVLIQSIFPLVTAESNKDIIKTKAKKLFKYNLMLGIIMCLFINLAAPVIIHILAGHTYDSSIPLLKILSVVPIILAFSSSLSTYCFALKIERYQVCAYLCGVMFCIASNLIFIKKYSYFAISINFILCEILSLVILFLLIRLYSIR